MTETRSPKTEMEHHKHAFELYYRLGLKRKYATVAAEFDRSVSTIKNWSRDFMWRQRVEERDADTTRVFAEKAKTKAADEVERALKLLDLIQACGAKDLVDGRSKSSPSTLLKSIETRIRLLEKTQEAVEAEGKPASARPVLVMLNNGRGDCTLPRASGPNDKGEDKCPLTAK